MKEIKEKLSKRRDAPCSYMGRLNAVKMSVLPNCRSIVSMQSQSNLIILFCGYQQTDTKIYMEIQKAQNSPHTTERNKVRGMILPNF